MPRQRRICFCNAACSSLACRLYSEQRQAPRVNALPLAVWAVNDLPGIHSPYSPHKLVFGRDPIGFGDCLPVQDECAEDALTFFSVWSRNEGTCRKN